MYSKRKGASFQPHPLAATAGVDQSVDTFVLARDHHPAAVAGKLLLDPIQTLLPKAPAEDCLLVHEMPNIPSGNSRNLQGLWRKAVPIRAAVTRSQAHPAGEFRLRIVPRSREAVRLKRRSGKTPAVLRPRREEMKVVIAASRTKRLHVRSGDVAIRLTTANRAAFAQALERASRGAIDFSTTRATSVVGRVPTTSQSATKPCAGAAAIRFSRKAPTDSMSSRFAGSTFGSHRAESVPTQISRPSMRTVQGWAL